MSTTALKQDGTRLLYDGRPLALDPDNATLSGVAALLADDRLAYVNLQPGDGTSYKFLLIPVTAARDAWLLQLSDDAMADSVLLIRDPSFAHVWTRGRPESAAALCTIRNDTRRAVEILFDQLRDAYPNPHARTVLRWWLGHLWARVHKMRAMREQDQASRRGRLGIGADDDHSGPAAEFTARPVPAHVMREIERVGADMAARPLGSRVHKDATWHCLYCHTQLEPNTQCMKPPCVEQRDAAAVRMGLGIPDVIRTMDEAVAAIRAAFPQIEGHVSGAEYADDTPGSHAAPDRRFILYVHQADLPKPLRVPLAPQLGAGRTWWAATDRAALYLRRMFPEGS